MKCDVSLGRLEYNEAFKEPLTQLGHPLLQVGPPEWAWSLQWNVINVQINET